MSAGEYKTEIIIYDKVRHTVHDYGARFYDPLLGRFLSADTVVPQPGHPQALNRYSYVLNNPLKYTDPTGHANIAGTTPDDTEGGKYIPPPPVKPPTCDENGVPDQTQAWVYTALVKNWYYGGSEGRKGVRRFVKANPTIFVYNEADLDRLIANAPPGLQEQLEYIKTIGAGHWFGTIYISSAWIGRSPGAWESSVLIHEHDHRVQMGVALGMAGYSFESGAPPAVWLWAATPSMEKERGAFWVQGSILSAWGDPGAIEMFLQKLGGGQKELTVALSTLKEGGPEAYDWIRGKNNFYQLWPPTIAPWTDTTRQFPFGI